MTEPRDEIKELLAKAKALLGEGDHELQRLLAAAGVTDPAKALAELVIADYSLGVKAHALAKAVLAQAAKRDCLVQFELGAAHGREVRVTEERDALRAELAAAAKRERSLKYRLGVSEEREIYFEHERDDLLEDIAQAIEAWKGGA